MTLPWTDAEIRRLRASARKKVNVEDIAKSLGRHAGSVKRKARELGVILLKKQRQKALAATVEPGLRAKK
jgi:IS30 family transposase